MTPIAINETECTFTHEGRDFTSGGAFINDDYACVYAIDDELGERSAILYRDWTLYARASGIAQTWHGQRVGHWRATSQFFAGWQNSARMRAIRLTLDDGRIYAGRYCPDSGDYVRCKRIKSKSGGSK